MVNNKLKQITKKDISRKICSKIGFSNSYANKITEDIIDSLKDLIKSGSIKISNFGTFRILNKNERSGRNPKSGKAYLILPRKSLSFIPSKTFVKKINYY